MLSLKSFLFALACTIALSLPMTSSQAHEKRGYYGPSLFFHYGYKKPYRYYKRPHRRYGYSFYFDRPYGYYGRRPFFKPWRHHYKPWRHHRRDHHRRGHRHRHRY